MINTAMLAEESRQRNALRPLPVTSGRMTQEEYESMDPAANANSTSSSRSTTKTTWSPPSGNAPSMPELGTFQAPEWNEGEIARNRQRIAGPNIRRLRDVTLQSIGKNFENPNVRRMTVREALQGYGSGLGSILASASQGALNQYSTKYGHQYNASMANFNAVNQAKMAQFNNLWNLFTKQGTTTQTSSSSGTSTGAGNSSNQGMGVRSVETPQQTYQPTWSPEKKYQNFTVYAPEKSMPYFTQGTSGY